MQIELPTPCQIIDIDKLVLNLKKAQRLRDEAGCKILLALKGFSSEPIFPYFKGYLDGASASSLYEAKLGRESFGGEIHTFSTAFTPHNIKGIAQNSDYVIFNSVQQYEQFKPDVSAIQAGIRVNPEYSENPNTASNPCKENSHLGVRQEEIRNYDVSKAGLKGFHLHTMRANNAEVLERTLQVVENKFGKWLPGMSFLNLGGGQLIADPGYNMELAIQLLSHIKKKYSIDVIMEPCEGLVSETGCITTRVIDIKKNKTDVAIVDASPMCHLPMTMHVPYTCEIKGELENDKDGYTYILAGPTCYAGDVWGQHTLPNPLRVGDVIYIQDTAQYSTVLSSMFNGIGFPYLAVYSREAGFKLVKEYTYETFKEII